MKHHIIRRKQGMILYKIIGESAIGSLIITLSNSKYECCHYDIMFDRSYDKGAVVDALLGKIDAWIQSRI